MDELNISVITIYMYVCMYIYIYVYKVLAESWCIIKNDYSNQDKVTFFHLQSNSNILSRSLFTLNVSVFTHITFYEFREFNRNSIHDASSDRSLI